ncbi:hypothetical protein GCM10009574_100340 [Streptomyces asiaticus]|uniref:Uncharacterized protein n=2 Tax=Streptomyces rhizosphaericus TaxID=114699 RepID=A0ABN1RRU5_9ACTN
MAQGENLDVLVGVAHRQQPQESEHVGKREVEESQQHDGSSWRTSPVTLSRILNPAGHSLRMRFSAPTATLIDPIHMLTEWARANGDAVLDALDADPEPVTHSD